MIDILSFWLTVWVPSYARSQFGTIRQLIHLLSNNIHEAGDMHVVYCFYYDAAGRPTMVRVGNEEAGSEYYTYVHSLQGDILGIIDNEQDLVVEYTYNSWGKPPETRCMKTGCKLLAEMSPFQYKGYVFDEETGLYYLRSRYYNPVWQRFVNADFMLGYSGRLLAHNIFTYCYNDPCVFSDVSGSIPSHSTLETDTDRGLYSRDYAAWLRNHAPGEEQSPGNKLKKRLGNVGNYISDVLHVQQEADILSAQMTVNAINTIGSYITEWYKSNERTINSVLIAIGAGILTGGLGALSGATFTLGTVLLGMLKGALFGGITAAATEFLKKLLGIS